MQKDWMKSNVTYTLVNEDHKKGVKHSFAYVTQNVTAEKVAAFGKILELQHDDENDRGVDDDVSRRDPNDLFELGLEAAEPRSDTGAERRLILFHFGFLFDFFVLFLFDVSHFLLLSLLGFSVQRVLAAETAILVHLETIGIVLLVLLRIVVTLFAFAASESDLNSHLSAPP